MAKKKDPFYVKNKADQALRILINRAKTGKKSMTYKEFAMTYKELKGLAMTYKDLGGLIQHNHRNMGRILEYIRDCICKDDEYPKLNLLIYSKKTGVPGINAIPGRSTLLSKEEYKLKLKEIFDYDGWDKLLK